MSTLDQSPNTLPGKGSAWRTLRRGLAVSPEITRGIWITLALSLISTIGRVIVPVTVQQTLDRGFAQGGASHLGVVAGTAVVAAGAVLVSGVCAYLANVRVFRATEAGLATLRVAAFRRVHDLSVLTQNSQRRGTLVARVTTDVDTISTFIQFGGLLLVLSAGQVLIATAVMAWYSWQLMLLVWACFLPLFLMLPRLQRIVARAYMTVRERVGNTLAAVSESVVGADTIRAYAIETRTQRRIDEAIAAHRSAATRAQLLVAGSFTGGVLVSGLTVAAVVGVGTWFGVDGDLTLGRLAAFLFLVQLFTAPVQMGTEVLNELQNAAAGWRRVLDVLDTPPDVADPPDGRQLPRGPIAVRFDGVGYRYPGTPDDAPQALSGVNLELVPQQRIAVVGETGSGKTTLAKLLTRLMDPTTGRVLLDDVDLRRIAFSSLRDRVVLVPQEGFLLDDTIAANLRWARPEATDADLDLAMTELGLSDWVAGLPHGLSTEAGQRGEALSAGERQLVALARAYLADPDLLVLDEATSAVDPATEVRLQRALDGATAGRTYVAIAHRLSTAESADLVVVVDAGRVVDIGPHAELLTRCAVYQRLHDSWTRGVTSRT